MAMAVASGANEQEGINHTENDKIDINLLGHLLALGSASSGEFETKQTVRLHRTQSL